MTPPTLRLHGLAALAATATAATLLLATGCSDDLTDIATPTGPVTLDIPAGGFATDRCRVLTVRPSLSGTAAPRLRWTLGDSLLSTADSLDFIAPEAGTYRVSLHASTGGDYATVATFDIRVRQEATPYSPYVTAVTDYRPAPGQFVNELPAYEPGDSQPDMNRKALEAIGHNTRGMITLGAYGGYVVCGFDHTIPNLPGRKDFRVLGNAFYAAANPNPDAPANGGSCEPGIVCVAYDRNRNGRPDADEWYELAGSEYHNPATRHNYTLTYRRPDDDREPVPAPGGETWNTDAEYIAWYDDTGATGFLPRNIFHRQSYYPLWAEGDELDFTGTLLPPNARDESGTGTYWVLYAYAWGYADNVPNTDDAAAFDIGWAVDALGRPVHLPGADFVKVYTGVNQHCGWLGETSTEIMGIDDLHLSGR